ncbi:hypothetical protein OOK60_06835 [Trichothermofontia sichuanensis B231]|uniref:hypothetical protein n=1 Tax=Trichothermofontia sichuanensis TaxID=3045816 RepID=UPI00224518D0|nr:hypothetical protein [Trichothermofontia sichuanensis]UZQ55780.1 hypothetical protein OOK60_06835 [Trichothermofontia sichuanensis B231]
MVHTYEVFVDMKEYLGQSDGALRLMSARYEVDAESREQADIAARGKATGDYPQATEYDVRVTRLLL